MFILSKLFEKNICSLPGSIWRIQPGEDDRWVLEWRNPDSKTLGFSVVDLAKREPVRIDTAPGAVDWWSSLAAMGRSSFLVHIYRFPDIPEPTDTMAFGLADGELRWVLPDHRFLGFSDQGQLVLGKKSGEGLTAFLCDESNGKVISPYAGEVSKRETDWQEALRYREGEEYYDVLKSFIDRYTNLEPVGTIEYMDNADRMVFSFYLYENKSLAQYVAVVNRSRRVEYCERIEQHLEKEGENALLMRRGWVFFVKDKTNFVGVNLSI